MPLCAHAQSGHNYSKISRELEEVGCSVSRQSVSAFVRRSKRTQQDQIFRQNNHKRVLTTEHFEFIDHEMVKNDEL